MEKIKTFESFEYDSKLNESKFARNTPDSVKKRKIRAKLEKLSGKEKKKKKKNMWPEDRKLLNIGKGLEKRETEGKEMLADIKAKLHPLEWKFLKTFLHSALATPELVNMYTRTAREAFQSILNEK